MSVMVLVWLWCRIDLVCDGLVIRFIVMMGILILVLIVVVNGI